MTVLGRLLGSGQTRPQNAMPLWGDWLGQGSETWAGNSVSTSSSVQMLTVYGCARFIADGISTLPVHVFRRTSDGPQQLNTPSWLSEPTPDLDFVAWSGQVLLSLLLDGNAWVYVQRSGGTITGLIPLDPTTVTIRRDRGRKIITANGMDFSTFEIGHIPGLMFPGSDKGLSPVEAARQTVGQGMAAQEFAARFFGQGATVSGVLQTDQDLTDGQAKDLARSFSRAHAGSRKSHLPAVLENGLKWQQTGITQEQAQFLETRKFNASEIAAQMFLIDPSEMGLPVDGSSLTYANLEQRNARKVQVTYLPWITRLENFVNGLLARPRYMKLNVNGLLRGDMKTRFESYAIGIENAFMVPNEAREFEDWTPLDGGDEIVVETTPGVTE